jgi:hypothetical protein
MAITLEIIEKGYTQASYLELFERLVEQGMTTGENQSEDMIGYTKLNWQRLMRSQKTLKLPVDVQVDLKNLTGLYVLLVLTEPWCGDAANATPVFGMIDEQAPNVELRYILRDEHLDIIDEYLTNSGRSIPKAIILKKDSLEVLGSWGPRPQKGMEMLAEYKSGTIDKDEFYKQLQRFYAKNKGEDTFREILEILKSAE